MRCMTFFFDFANQTDPLIFAKRPDLMLINEKKENVSSSEICHSSGLQSKNKRKRKDRQILGPCQRTKKTVEQVGDSYTNCRSHALNSPQWIGRVGNQRKNWNHSDYSIIEISH